ncbi:hypothetical protein JCM8097_003538 [Rhodosporidiobolus ruineniae]
MNSHLPLYVALAIAALAIIVAAVYFFRSSSSSAASPASSSSTAVTSGETAPTSATAGSASASVANSKAKAASGTASAAAASASSSASSTSSSLPPNGKKAGLAGGTGFDSFKDHIGWWYDWNADGNADHTATGVSYMSMLWGDGHVDSTDSARLSSFKSLSTAPTYVLGFNEPDLSTSSASSNITASDAASLWDELIAPWQEKGSLLGSPACGMQGGETWLSGFKGAISTDWDFTAVHIYQQTVDDVANVVDHYIQYGKPIVVTEWGMMDVSTGFDPITNQSAINQYIEDCVKYFEGNSSVVGYAAIVQGSGLGDVWPLADDEGNLSARRGFLSKLNPKQLKRIPRDPRKLRPFRGNAQRRDTLFQPLKEGDEPLGTLVVRVHAGRNLIPKDRNGLSDPYVVIRYGAARVTSPTVPKSLNPVWGTVDPSSSSVEGVAGEAKLELPVFDSLALGRERIEIVCWDRDRVGSEYLGELSLGLEDWWGSMKEWKEGKPPVGFYDDDNKPVWHTLRSSRSRSAVSGELLVQVGFVPLNVPERTPLSSEQRERIFAALQRVADELEGARRASREDRVLLAAPTEGVGTSPIAGSGPFGDMGDPELSTSSSDSELDDASTASGEESDTEEGESISADEDEAVDTTEVPTDYFDLPRSAGALTSVSHSLADSLSVSPSAETAGEVGPPPPVPAIVVEKAGAKSAASSAGPSPSPSPAPSSATPSIAPTPPPVKRGLSSFPGFIKRRFSAQSLATSSGQLTPAAGAGDSDVTGTDLETGASSAAEDGKPSRRRRFVRRKKKEDRSDSIDVADELVEMSLVAGGVGTSQSPSPSPGAGGEKKRRRKRREKKSSSEEVGAEEGGRKRRGKRRGKKGHGGFTYEDEDGIAGLVQIEIVGAKGLPRFKNALRTGYDMDPFCVISFGRKIFRTRVIRHSLNPVWEERLWFHVGEAETHWTIGFTVSDWDKISGNDHVGDVAVELDKLLGTSIQPDERGLFPANGDGKLSGDDFHDHDLPLLMSANEKDLGDAKPTLHIRAKYTPYAALRQSFWRIYAKQYDIDENGELSYVELFSMLDSLGSTLSKDTIASFFTRFGKTTDDELTIDEVVLCLEEEVKKPKEEKRILSSEESGLATPAEGGPGGGSPAGDFAHRESPDPEELQTDHSSNMKTISPGTEVVTDKEKGTTVEAPKPSAPVRASSSADSLEPSSGEQPSSDESGGTRVERVINIKECPLCHKPRLSGKAEASIVTHLGICASTDPTKVNRVLVTNYVTASQAQRKFLNKVFSKVMKGSYNLGADSANIIVQDRQTGALQEEKMAVYVRLGIRLMYKGMSGNMEGARIRRLLDSLTKKQGFKYDSPSSAREIEPFIKFHNLNLEEVLDPLSEFKTFNQFFYRKLKPDARPIADPDDPRTLVSCADCRAMFFQTVNDATSIWIKGREFSIARMLGEHYGSRAAEYEGGSLAIFRLAPQDYHRYHSPVDGVMGRQEYIAGQYYTVNPMAIRSAISVYTENVRLVAPISSPVFGDVMNVWVGAMMVASINMTKKEGDEVKRGDDVGYFAFGGSTIVVVFKPNTVQFDEDLLRNSRHSVETLIRVNTRIGRAVEKKA